MLPSILPSEKMHHFLEANPRLETPFFLIDLDLIEQQYRLLREALPFAACYFAMKSNSSTAVIQRLNQLGSRFEAASIYEIRRCLALGVPPRDIHFGNTIKKDSHILEAYRLGVHSYAFDSSQELEKIAQLAPGSNVSCRLATDGKGAVWGLCRKFGRDPDDVVELMKYAHSLGLRAYGISFHTGSQQRSAGAWRRTIEICADIIQRLNQQQVYPRLINLGGGFPSYQYAGDEMQPQGDIFEYGKVIKTAVDELLPQGIDCVMEPGRFITAAAGLVKATVILVLDKATDGVPTRWVYLDAGRFNGLYESVDVEYPIITNRTDGTAIRTVLAGPTCDSDDVMYDRDRAVFLPDTLTQGDSLIFTNAGAYSKSYMTVDFNGFPPMQEYVV
ncbi:Ornithine decarboxylase [gamma proteobacterium HdN1]|nr:Ornithine decarboxylase [gamma proteobacterium HdN1]